MTKASHRPLHPPSAVRQAHEASLGEITPEQARVGAYFTVFTDLGLDHYGRYRDTFVPVDDRWLIRHRFVSTDWRAGNSVMAAPDSVH